MDKQLISDGVKDYTNLLSDGTTQYKIYTPESYFFIINVKDSAVGFGVGNYQLNDKHINESNIYNTNTLDTVQEVELEVTSKEKGYSQNIPEMVVGGKKLSIKEEYTTISSAGTSVLDGIWHQEKYLEIKGGDTLNRTYNEYKVFQVGHFMWGARFLSDTSSNIYSNMVGHGTYTLNNNALTEYLDMSSVKSIIGKYQIIITFNGSDEFTQKTEDTVNHTIGLKTYKRISK